MPSKKNHRCSIRRINSKYENRQRKNRLTCSCYTGPLAGRATLCARSGHDRTGGASGRNRDGANRALSMDFPLIIITYVIIAGIVFSMRWLFLGED